MQGISISEAGTYLFFNESMFFKQGIISFNKTSILMQVWHSKKAQLPKTEEVYSGYSIVISVNFTMDYCPITKTNFTFH